MPRIWLSTCRAIALQNSTLFLTLQNMQTDGAGQIELGATWLHGIKGHPAYDLALERGLIKESDKQKASM